MTSNRMCTFLGAALLLAPLTLNAQGGSTGNAGANANTTQGAGSMPAGTEGSDAGGRGMTPMRMDKMFLRKAAQGGMTEIQFAQLALQKTSNDGVKQFAQKMIDDHTQMNADLKPFADQMGVVAPTSLAPKDQAMYDKLNTMSGAGFDKAYLAYMTKDHQKDQREFAKELSTTTNQDLKATVTKGKGVIDQHLSMVEDLDKTNGVAASHSAGE